MWFVRRLLALIPTLAAVIVVGFAVVRLAPGSPFAGEKALAPQVRIALEARFGLDLPLGHQMVAYVVRLLHADLGPSIKYPDHEVTDLILAAFPHTALLACTALGWALVWGTLAGMAGALATMRRRPTWDLLLTVCVSAATSLPSFVLGPLLVLGASTYWGLLPPAGWGEPRHVVLPALTLGTLLGAQVARLTRGGLLALIHQDFVRTAKAKGLPPLTILRRHMLKPALIPLITFLGPTLSGLLVGSVAVEKIFGVPGLGMLFVDAAFNRDYFLVMGIVVFESVLLLVCNMLVDAVYTLLDPRVRLGG